MRECQFCGKKFEKQGSVNLHEYWCKDNPKNKDQGKTKTDFTKCECGGKLRPLKGTDKAENLAIQDGYIVICDNCLEIYK